MGEQTGTMLRQWGVHQVSGYPGEGSNGLLAA